MSDVPQVGELPGHGVVARAADFSSLQKTVSRFVQLIAGDAIAQQALEFFLHVKVHAADVLRIADGGDGQSRALVLRRRRKARSDSVRQTILLPDARPKTGREGASAQNVITEQQGRVLRIIVSQSK